MVWKAWIFVAILASFLFHTSRGDRGMIALFLALNLIDLIQVFRSTKVAIRIEFLTLRLFSRGYRGW